MSSVYDLIASRQSDRAYDTEKEVDKAVIERIIETARLAPSACNSQPWHLIAVTDKDKRMAVADALASMGMNKFASQAPCHIVIVQESPNFSARIGGWVQNKHYPLIDCGIMAAHITLLATEEGLGSCILGWFDEKKMKKALGIPKGKKVLLDIVFGHSVQKFREKNRKKAEEISSFNEY